MARTAAAPELEQDEPRVFDGAPVVRAFIEDSTVVTGYFGPFGCAKTSGGAVKAWSYGQVFPGARGAIIRATWPELRDTTMKTFFEWFPDGIAGHYEATPKTFWMHTRPGEPPMEILFRAMDQVDDIANVLSMDLAWAWLDEPQGGVSLKEAGRGSRTIVKEPGILRRQVLWTELYVTIRRPLFSS